jgi:hypothetical protein
MNYALRTRNRITLPYLSFCGVRRGGAEWHFWSGKTEDGGAEQYLGRF